MTTTHDPVEDRIRHALHTVAATVTDESPATARPGPAPARRRRRRRRWPWAVGALVVGVPLSVAATAGLRSGPEYVDAIPPHTILVDDEIDGDRYLVVESRRTDRCGRPATGVELLRTSSNILGSEWNTIGAQYGQYRDDDCGTDPGPWLADPARYADGGLDVGDSVVWYFAVHPDVEVVRITTDDGVEELRPFRVDGAGYAFWEVPSAQDPKDREVTLLVGDRELAGWTDDEL